MLMVLVLSEDVNNWIRLGKNELMHDGIMYYYDKEYITKDSLNSESKTQRIKIPLENVVNPENLHKLFLIFYNYIYS
mgnify:CR=1 FL=1